MFSQKNTELFTKIDDNQASTIKGGSVSLLNGKADIQESTFGDLSLQITVDQILGAL